MNACQKKQQTEVVPGVSSDPKAELEAMLNRVLPKLHWK